MNQTQFCPCCGNEARLNTRYPGYLCNICIEKLHDGNNQAVIFTNSHFGGFGLMGYYKEYNQPYQSNRCFVNHAECRA